MDANLLIKALGDAAGAAKPPQEYCFLWIDWWATCMTKAEWSGWMQAVFSVIAIVSAALLALWQFHAARSAENDARQRQDLENDATALQVCERISRLARATQRIFEGEIKNEVWFARFETRWENLIACVDALIAKELEGSTLKLMLDSRGFASIALAACRTRDARIVSEVGFANLMDVYGLKRDTANARWKLRKSVRQRRKANKQQV